MSFRPTALGLGLIAVLAIGALAASVALADDEIYSEKNPTYFLGSSTDNVFFTHAGEIKCAKSTYADDGTGTNTTTATVTLVAKYEGCSLSGAKVAIAVNGCSFVLTLKKPTFTNTMGATLKCPAGKKIILTAIGCTVEIGAGAQNTDLQHVKVIGEGAAADRGIKGTITIGSHDEKTLTPTGGAGFEYTQTAGCPKGAGTFKDGNLEGTVLINGYTDAAHTTRQGIYVQ